MFTIFINFYIFFSVIILITTYFIQAPYGRYYKKKWGISIDDRFAWMLMEIISPISLIFSCFWFAASNNIAVIFLITIWTFHYLNRSMIYPFFIRKSSFKKKMSLFTVLCAILFNLFNGSINGYALAKISNHLDEKWIFNPIFILGVSIFITGFLINLHSDLILGKIRRISPLQEYEIPNGGMFKLLSSPNYFGEIVEWVGFAIASWNLASICFALFTFSYLFPRAMNHHAWYKGKFPAYPTQRKAILPFII